MNRELKFRIWDNHTKCYKACVYESHKDCYLFIGRSGYVTAFNCYGEEIDFKDDRFIIQQYTGLKDSKGVEIYEGDILRHEFYPHNKNFVMKWNVLSWELFDTKEYDGEYIESAVTFDVENDKNRWVADELEVICNIFENPELLKA